MEKIAMADWLKAYDKKNGVRSIPWSIGIDAVGVVRVRVDSTLPSGVEALGIPVEPTEILDDGRTAAFTIEENGSVSLLVGEGEVPKFVPSVPKTGRLPLKPMVIPFERWFADYKAVRVHKAKGDRDDEARAKSIRIKGLRIGDGNRVKRIVTEEKGCFYWDESFIDLQRILLFTYGLVRNSIMVSWGQRDEGGYLNAYFNENLDVVFDADTRCFYYSESYNDDYFRKSGRAKHENGCGLDLEWDKAK